ncbi:MAG: leucine-rich repeat protein, partial [Clostridia bacterium]|nr:leucine-rich repeat protein [Clostridia bacterium]
MSIIGALSIGAGVIGQSFVQAKEEGVSASAQSNIVKTDASIDTNIEQFFDESVVQQLPTTVAKDEEISVIVQLNDESIMDSFKAQSDVKTVSEYATSREAKALSSKIERKQQGWINRLQKSGINYKLGEQFDTVINGFEIVIKASEFDAAAKFFANDAKLIVGDVYEVAQTEPIHNYVDVYDTGIFNTSTSTYQGDGVVVAVLDTGLDYTHTAFSVDNFTTEIEAFTLGSVSQKVGQTVAAEFTEGLTGEDVYVSKKVPFAYDYADKDPDVLPINSEHGTHVAGIIAGKDDEITGVAPNAQLAIMKVFSDAQQGAKDSWILAALEDCVTLGVDVINMSLGSNCGFAREVDKKNTAEIYDSIRDAGISLIAAAGNDNTATVGSEKNGSNPLTSNPDFGPVGAPSTYAASLCVASVDGVKTPYLRYGDEIFYFKEATASDAKPRHFVDEILEPLGVDSYDFEYVTIPGIGRSSDYPEAKEFYKGKIVLVKRGQTTFEDKVRVAIVEKGAAGIIIYNNVSGDISMSIGESSGAVCSISQEHGEKLAAAGSGIIRISKNQVAGPFMSDFSSWGPTSDLQIKPEITAHGGEIYSAVPGQAYDRLSGTSMAAPNQAGAAALIRQYVKYENVFGTADEMEADPVRVTTLVNQLMMSTADIVLNKNGLPYSVRKQGSGLVNIADAYSTASYVSTYKEVEGADGSVTLEEMDRSKLELGDDKDRTGVYKMTFAINNVSANSVTYELGSIIQTEGVSTIYTSHSDTTVTLEGYLLEGTQMNILSVSGGEYNGMNVTVASKSKAVITAEIVLSAEDKAYLDASFKYGMYVEGYITMKGVAGTTVDMNVPMLAFYGDWTEAPIFDEEYYDTHKDEINAGIDPEDKLMPDAYATRVIGGLYSDYIATLGTYYFIQDPSATQIAADKDKIALSNQEQDKASTINSIYAIWAGLLRNVKEWTLTIVEDSTGELVYTQTEYNQRKSSNSGGAIYQSSMKVDFSVLEHNLKNNTKYTVKVETFIDYDAKSEQNNVRNTFEFPLYIDFQAPVVTDVAYRTEYDKTTKKTSLFADISVYDNHYSMGMQVGQIVPETDPTTAYIYSMESFGKYITPIYSSYNSTSTVTVELTDYIQKIKESCGPVTDRPNDGSEDDVIYNNNSFLISCYDYAMNYATYQVRLPDEIISMYFDIEGEELRLSPNETKDLTDILKVFPEESWIHTLDFETSDSSIVDIVNQTVIAKKSGEATVTAIGYDSNGKKVSEELKIKVLAEGEEGYNGSYTIPEINKFTLMNYYTNKAYYAVNSEDREIGLTGSMQSFGNSMSLSMFPSESVTLKPVIDSYFEDRTAITYSVGNSKIATVSDDGTIVAQAEGTTSVSVDVTFDGKSTFYSGRVSITVKDPYTTNSIYLMSYKGLGGEVIIPADRGFTTIYAYAFSNYEYVEKDLEAGDVINDEDPYHIKQHYIGENTITKVVIPEGVTHINEYAFANLTALEEVVLPESLINVGVGAFYNCVKLKKINLNKVKFINESAFENCALEELELDSINAIGNEAFKNCMLNNIKLPKSSQSLGIGAFANNKYLTSVSFLAPKMKIGASAFDGCTKLTSIEINAAVIAAEAFSGCTALKDVKLGKDVAVIGEYAFGETAVEKFSFMSTNDNFELRQGGAYLYKKGTNELVLAAPAYAGEIVDGKVNVISLPDTTAIGKGAFSGNTKIFRVIADKVTDVGAYAFAGCESLDFVSMNSLVNIGDYAFEKTVLKATPSLANVENIGNYAFLETKLETVEVENINGNAVKIGNYAFAHNKSLHTVKIGNDVTIGEGAFYCEVKNLTYDKTGSLSNYNWYAYDVLDEEGNVAETYDYYRYDYSKGAISVLTTLEIGSNVEIGKAAFSGNVKLTTFTLGDNATIGEYAFFNSVSLTTADLSKVEKIGAYAFSSSSTPDIWLQEIDGKEQKMLAYDLRMVNGELEIVDYMYSSFAPSFTSIDLSSVKQVGEGAFAYNRVLESVVIGENIAEWTVVDGVEKLEKGKIPKAMFAECKALENVVLPATVSAIGEMAFYRSNLQSVNLENVSYVGKGAFTSSALKEVTLKEGATVGQNAFAYCEDLVKVTGIETVKLIEASAFASTALTEVKLTGVTEIGDFAFASTELTKVELGDKLEKLGENPFYATKISTYGREEDLKFNVNDQVVQVVGKKLNENYEIGESKAIKVIEGVLYQVLPNGGLELVSYPA